MQYTKKYWTIDAKELETRWVGQRLYQPPIEQVLHGAFEEDKENRYYAKEMRYPIIGGYQSFIRPMVDESKIHFSAHIVSIDVKNKQIHLDEGKIYEYQKLISTIPLPELCALIRDVPDEILKTAGELNYSSGLILSLGFNKPDVPKYLWYYIYDEDILPARVYSPSLKSPNNVPDGCSSIQAEIYYSKFKPLSNTIEQIMEKTIEDLSGIMKFSMDDIVVNDIRKIKYANVIFTPDIYRNRQIIHEYLNNIGIYYAGRFGEWDYLWSDQSIKSGRLIAELINEKF